MENNNTFTAKLRSDKRKNPTYRNYRRLTFDEVKSSNGKHVLCLDRNGDIANVHITSIKTWKTRPEIEVHYQFGLYEHYIDRGNAGTLWGFVIEVGESES